MYAELCEQHLQSGSLGRGRNGKGGGRKNGEREKGCVYLVGGGDFSVGERKWQRKRTEGGEGCTCVFTGVCVCSAAVTSGEGE